MYISVSFVDLEINEDLCFLLIALSANDCRAETAFAWASRSSAIARIFTVFDKLLKPCAVAVWNVIILPKSVTLKPEYDFAYPEVGRVWLEPDA